MRPSPAANEAAVPRSRKASLVGDQRPSITSAQPTSFFLAREEDIFGPSLKTSSRRSSAAHTSDNKEPMEASGLSLSSEGKTSQPDSVYGVQSLEEALGQAFGEKSRNEEEPATTGLMGLLKRKRRKPSNADQDQAHAMETATDDTSSRHSSPQHHTTLPATRSSRTNTISQPLTPLQLESPFPESAAMPSTPKSGSFRSLRLSDEEEDNISQAITSGGEEEEEEEEGEEEAEEDAVAGSMADARGSFPELVMPSLAMPSRRPFTERGKQMGRLKVAVAGANGVGKTSLLRAIVRQCEDIVHIDPVTAPTPGLQTPQTGKKGKRSASTTTHITEIQASTKAYPTWWSEMEDSRVLRRRKSMNETVLERNICFIDSPGFDSGSALKFEQQPLVRYLEILFHKNTAITELGGSDLLGVLSGAGGVQIDIVLYICSTSDSVTQHDFEYMSKLSKYASVIPIITKVDKSPEAELAKRKAAIAQELPRCNVNASVLSKSRVQPVFSEPEQTPMPEDLPSSAYLGQAVLQAPFLVSCLPGSDDGEMDASLLMSPSYTPPLVSSELQALVSLLFEPETMTKLRHISARKFLQWREKLGAGEAGLSADSMALGPVSSTSGLGIKDHLALARHSPPRSTSSPTSALVRRGSGAHSPFNLSSTSSIGSGLPDFSRARIKDHILREERLAQVQLAKWASDLQRSIRREREEYARLVDGERAKWLLERVGVEASHGRISSFDGEGEKPIWALSKSERKLLRRAGGGEGMELPSWARVSAVDARDPLGLCGIGDGARRTGDVVLKVLGGGVLVGAVWIAICRAWGVDPERWWSPGAWW